MIPLSTSFVKVRTCARRRGRTTGAPIRPLAPRAPAGLEARSPVGLLSGEVFSATRSSTKSPSWSCSQSPFELVPRGLVGFGRNRLLRVPVDGQGRMRADRLPPLSPATIVCAQAGNVNTGAFDPLAAI